MQKVSIAICTINEEDVIEDALKSSLWADEIVLIDSGSSDNTIAIASKYTRQIKHNEFKSYSAQKQYAIDQCSNDWVFILDADERITPELAEKINDALNNPKCNAFKIKRNNFFMDKRIQYSGWQNDWVIRLVNKKYCTYNDNNVHESIIVKGDTNPLKEILTHYTYKNLSHYLKKIDEFSDLAAKDIIKKGKTVRLYHITVKPIIKFLRQYLFKGGFLDGKVGFILSSLGAFSVFLRNIKAWRIQNGEIPG